MHHNILTSELPDSVKHTYLFSVSHFKDDIRPFGYGSMTVLLHDWNVMFFILVSVLMAELWASDWIMDRILCT